MAQRYNRKQTVSSGYGYMSMKNKAMQAKQARAEGNYNEAQQVFDAIDNIFSNEEIDLNKATAILNPNKIRVNQRRKESTDLTSLLTQLHSDNFFELVPNSGFTPNSAIEKAIDFNNKITYNQQGVSTFASYTDVIASYERLQEMKKAGAGNYLYLFDTETIGGTNKSNIWSPLGITEFAMQKVDLGTGAVNKTNIVLGTADTLENRDTIETILNALGTSLYETNKDKQYKVDPNIIMKNEQLRVTAYRYAIYGSPESVFKDSGKGYMEAVSLASSDINDWLDPEKIKAGYLKNVDAFKASPMTDYGINVAQKTFIDSVSEMYHAAKAGTGMIGGQNIVPFDIPVVNSEIARITQQLQDIVDGKILGGDKTKAQAGLNYIKKAFDGNRGFTAPSQQIYDTLPMIKFIRDTFGIDPLYDYNQEAIMKAGSGLAKQENIGAVWFPELFASGEAHMADFDVDVQRNLFTTPIEKLGNKTFMEHFMEVEDNGGLKALGLKAQTIKTGEQQLLYAKKGTRDRAYTGKGALDYTINKKTGEVFFGSNYEIMGPNKTPEFKGDINMGTNIKKGHFYYVDSIKQINANDLPKELGATLPELSSPEIFQVRMRMAVADEFKNKGLEDLEYVMHFNSAYEVSGWFSSHFGMPAYRDENGKWKLDKDSAMDLLEQVKMENGAILRDEGFYLQNNDVMINDALKASNKRAISDKTLRDLSDPNRQYKEIEKHVKMRKTLSKAGLDNITEDEISDLLNGKVIPRMANMPYQDSKSVIDQVRYIAGFRPDNSNETKLYSNTINRISSAWGFVSMRDDFYMQVFDDLENFANQNNFTKKQREYMFSKTIESLSAQVANDIYESSNGVRNAVHSTTGYQGPLENIKNVFDIELPDSFILEQSKSQQVISALNFEANKNILSVRLDNIDTSSFNLEDALVKMRYGTRNLRSNPENYKRIAMHQFVTHLNGLEDFADNKYIRQALRHINKDTKNFSINTASRLVIQAMQDVKNVDPTKGVLKDIAVRTLESSDEYNAALKAIAKDSNKVLNTMKSIPVPVDLPKTNTVGDIEKYVRNNVLKHYMPTRQAFEDAISKSNLTDDELWQKTKLYDLLEKQVTDRLVDVTEALSSVPNSELFVDPYGRFIFKQGQESTVIDNLTKIKLDGDTLYGQVGRSPVQLRLKYGVDPTGKVYMGTNIEEFYNKGKAVTRRIRKEVEDGTFRIDSVANITSNISKKFREDSRYEFKSGDWFSNFMVETGEIDTLLPSLFGEHGALNDLGDQINIPEDIKRVIRERIGKHDKEILPGELDPQLNQFLSPYRIQIARDLADLRGDDDIRRLSGGLTIGTKGKGKQVHGILMGSNLRFETGALNSFDNLGRPVVDSSGNVIWLQSENIKKAMNEMDGLFYEGSLFETHATDRVNRKIADGVGEITTSWSSRTAYVGEYGLRAILDNSMDQVLASNTVEHLADEQKENIYNMLYSYVNTFEQQKIYNARAFDAKMGGALSANTIKLSNAKDFVNVAKNEKNVENYKRLINLMGDISIDSDGVISYKSAVGDIVKRGETIVPYATFGGATENWTSKMDRALLNFQVTNKQGIKLTDDQISAVLNQNKAAFRGIDLTNREDVAKAIKNALDDYELNFALEDINRKALPKILVSDTEKSMNHILYAKTGTINDKVAQMFIEYGEGAEELLGGTVLTDQALAAVFKNQAKRNIALGKAGFANWDEFEAAWKQEMYTMSDMIFGKGGIFEGFTDVASDNLLGHENKGTMLIGSIEEAVKMLGKYMNGGVETEASRQIGLKEFAKRYNESDEFQFFRAGGEAGITLNVVDGRLKLTNGEGFDKSLSDSDTIDYQKLENLIRNVDSYIASLGAEGEDRLVHRVDIRDGNKYVALDNDGGVGTEIIGRMKYLNTKDGETLIVGSVGSITHKMVHDPETQSSMPQEYFDTKMDYLKLKGDKINLEHKYEALRKEYLETGSVDLDEYNQVTADLANAEQKLENMDEYLRNMEGTGHAYRIGDQEEKIIKNYFVNEKTYERIQLGIDEGRLSKEAVAANEALRGIRQEDFHNRKAYQDLIDELHAQKYYNPYIDSVELDENLLKKKKYAHLRGVYDNIIGKAGEEKLGLETAEIIHDIEMANLANEFNQGRATRKELEDAGFDILTPEKYINQFGDPSVPGYDSVYKQNVLLELDMMDGAGPRYVAVPGMGSVLDKAEIKQDWHKHAGKLSSIYQEEFLPAHGEPIEAKRVLDKMENVITDLKKSTTGYMEKGSVAHERMRQEVHAAVDRVKILSTMPTDKNPLFTQAMVDGKSLADWAKEGTYYDYAFDSLESFEKRGYFKQEFLDSMGMTREDMIEHLRTEGTIMLDDRYPNIRERSITPVRHYLAIGKDGTSFLANNATMMAPWTMLAMNADSDGDSVSRFLVKHKGTDYVQYGIARSRAVKSVDVAGGFVDDISREDMIRAQTVSNMQSMGITNFTEEDYFEFKTKDINMADLALTENNKWYKSVLDTWAGDDKKTKKAMVLKHDLDYVQAEVPGGKSMLGYTKLSALSETPDWDLVEANMKKVNNGLNVIKQNAQYLSPETLESVKDIIDKPADIWGHNNEADVLDRALVAMKELSSSTNASAVNADGFATFSQDAFKRIKINRYHEEGMQKLGVTATGNVNSTLYGISQAIKSRYGDNASPLYDELKRYITSDISYWAEETPISGKKFKVKAGDERMFEFIDAFKGLDSGTGQGPTPENLEAMKNYFKKYMNHDWIEGTYDSAMDKMAMPASKRLTDKAAKVDYVIDQYTSYVQEALDPSSSLYAEAKLNGALGRRSANPGAIFHASGRVDSDASNAGRAVFEMTGRYTSTDSLPNPVVVQSAQDNARRIASEARMPEVNTHPISEAVESVSNRISRSIVNGSGGLKKSLGLGVVGLAAGLIASGYASGNPLNDPDPATITQKGYEGVQAAPEMMFSSGQGFAPNNTGGYIINIKGDTRKGNRQLKKALKQATRNAVGPGGIRMEVKTSQQKGPYSDNDIENILNNFF